MINNYFFLQRLIHELKPLIIDSEIIDFFSQEKDKIVFSLQKSENNFFLEFDTTPNQPSLLFRDKFYRQKKNTISFFTEFIPQKIKNISIAKFERIIWIEGSTLNLFFIFRGKDSNLIVIGDDAFISFKSVDDNFNEKFQNELSSTTFTNDFVLPSLDEVDNLELTKIKTHFPFLTKEIISELEYRAKILSEEKKSEILKEILEEIFYSDFSIFNNAKLGTISIAPFSFKQFDNSNNSGAESIFDGSIKFISRQHQFSEYHNRYKLIQKYLERELSFLNKKISNLKKRIDDGSKEEYYKKIANLILINISSLEKGLESIVVIDIIDDSEEIKIILNPLLTPIENANNYFEKSKKEKSSFIISKELYERTNKQFLRMSEIYKKFNEINNIAELKNFMREYEIKENQNEKDENDLTTKFRRYVIDNKYHFFVGRDSKNNDLLTTKFAKQNDYWFHARGVSGSHCVLRVDNTKEGVPKSVIKKAASISAFHSKGKTSSLLPVAYALKKYVVKKKGMEIGSVILMKEDVILVKPEIPNGCEIYSDQEL
ncbi:MAG: hypothetical protein C0425_08415 [Chlorobiaceae bacterium]|nr:hypothetical protein [Chlorobiaceae bacterium]